MNAPPLHPDLSPDAYAVLLDVARQPDSVLLTVEPRKASRELLEPSDLLRPTAAFLTAAERHLLAAHRDEVGRWIDNLVAVEVVELPSLACRTYQRTRGREAFSIPSTDDCRRQLAVGIARRELASDAREGLLEGPSDASRQVARLIRLVSVAGRLRRSTHVTFHSGLISFAVGHPVSALQHFRRLSQTAGLVGRVALESMGMVSASCGEWEAARDAYAAASRSPWATVDSAANFAFNAMQLGEASSIDDALGLLRDFRTLQADEAARFTRNLAPDRWRPTDEFNAARRSGPVKSSLLAEVLDGTE